MQRWFRALVLVFVWSAVMSTGFAQPVKEVSGRIASSDVRVFVKDTLYRISGTYMIAGALVIEPGTRVEFLPNGRVIDSVGGRLIADGQVGAVYNNPFNPFQTINPNTGNFYTGYADLDYFANTNVTTAPNISEPTVSASKGDALFRVGFSTTDARLQNLSVGKAILYKASRVEFANSDQNLNQRPWQRLGGRSVNVVASRITFAGTAANPFSREWGHVIVLPGASAAYFRDVDFVNFRKDTTVDRTPYYATTNAAQESAYSAMNNRILAMTNGSGGALTSFSSRTWLVGCKFENNFARYHGGAVQLLQAPLDDFGASGSPAVYPDVRSIVSAFPFYTPDTNPNITDPSTGLAMSQEIRVVDNLRSPAAEPLSDANRQLVDDARLAVYLGRVREVTFKNNQVLIANVGPKMSGTNIIGIEDKTAEAAVVDPNVDSKNEAFGGALYIAGRNLMEIGFGLNDGFASTKDYVLFENNLATNLQPINPNNGHVTRGARGGSVYVGDATSVIFSGRFAGNETKLGFNANIADYSQGGAVYVSANSPRIQIRGGLTLRAGYEMFFENNKSGRGGAIYAFVLVPTNSINMRPSPIVGGSDASQVTRNYGFNVKFKNNVAVADGGAIYTTKRMSINGAGGTFGGTVNYGGGTTGDYRVEFSGNSAGFSGGAIAINLFGNLANNDRQVQIVRAIFDNNSVGNVEEALKAQVRGGGAIYTYNTELNAVKATEFINNKALNGNGGAVAVVASGSSLNRFFMTDLDNVAGTGLQSTLLSSDAVYTYNSVLPADVRSMTRFLGNEATANANQMGSGTTQPGDVVRTHPGTSLAENGTGLGGAIYILDASSAGRNDRFEFNRVRFQDNKAYSGAVVYSDNYDLKVVFQKSLICGNSATSTIGSTQNAITGPFVTGQNLASSDLAGAIMYGEILGPLPFNNYSFGANAIYDNNARFLIRIPDAPNTKGTRAGTGLGFGGVDTLRGNYWGRTEAAVNTVLPTTAVVQETFFIGGDGTNQLGFVRGQSGKKQGPFESIGRYSYTPLPVSDDFTQSIPEKLLQQGVVYDIFDKGTDIKTADYSNRRMSRIEDFAVGIPPVLRYFADATVPSNGKVVKRWLRDPFVAEVDANINALQGEFYGDHPIGYPVFLEAKADYSGDANRSNNNDRTIDETVFFVVNENTGDFIRANFAQVSKTSETFRARVELVPDSVDRSSNPLERRSAEGLANFGGGATLLENLRQNALNEDLSALQGRKYDYRNNSLGGANMAYSNRPELPASTNKSNGVFQNVTYFAGERYNALPVRVGDRVRIVSRTILWSKGANEAILRGLDFTVGTTTLPPVFTGNKVTLENIATPEFRNLVMLTEDVNYNPKKNGASGRDSIFSITAVDMNKFYDPRSIISPTAYTQLDYTWAVPTGSGLSYWLGADTVKNNNPLFYGAKGYIRFKGRPSNPFVVPGGEEVVVTARNFPPHVQTIDSLKAFVPALSASEIAKYIYLYPPYFNAQTYDAANARYLQQDTLNYGYNNKVEYKFKILVTDSIPVFTNSIAKCIGGDTLIASVTDSLRFDFDINTDDEAEDAAVEGKWDFRYGKTAYGFAVTNIRNNPGDTIRDGITQIRPIWLTNPYLQNDRGIADPLATAFTSKGILRSRLPFTQIRSLLTPKNQANQNLNTDTVVTIIANDGHGGLNTYSRYVLVNFAPSILNDRLDIAIEDQEYNRGLLDSNRAIKVYDPNLGQNISYRLIYSGETGILKDPCYPEAGNWNAVSSTAKTPQWIKIDPVSGRLYGTPRVTDAPRIGSQAELVTVVVTDAYGLTHVKTIPLEVRAVNHPPFLVNIPPVVCVDVDVPYTSEEMRVTDIDLRRAIPADSVEDLKLEVLQPAGFTTDPTNIKGPRTPDTATFRVKGTVLKTTPRNPDGTVTIIVRVTDKKGLTSQIQYKIAVSEKTDFLSTIRVTNQYGAYQDLQWGTAVNATTGEDVNRGGLGNLDSNYCEYEIPPIPPKDVFDARWTVSTRNGIIRTVVPTDSKRPINAIFQGGGVVGNTSTAYPIEVSWEMAKVGKPGTKLAYFLQDAVSNGNYFKINMSNGVGQFAGSFDVNVSGGVVKLTIKQTSISAFQIVVDSVGSIVGVDHGVAGFDNSFMLEQNYPNPFVGETEVKFSVPTSEMVTIEVFDAIGNKVATLANGFYEVGKYTLVWDGKSNGVDLPSGVYTYRMSAGAFSTTRKMILVK